MGLSLKYLDNATRSISQSYLTAQKSMALSLERLASGKKINRPSDDFALYLKTLDLSAEKNTYDTVATNLTEMSGQLEMAISAANNVLSDLEDMKAAWLEYEAADAGSAEQTAAQSEAQGYQQSIQEALNLTTSDGKNLIDDTSTEWDIVTLTGGSTLAIDLSGETVATGTEATSTATQSSIDNMVKYIGALQKYKNVVDSQLNLANSLSDATQDLSDSLTTIDEAEEMANYTEQDIRQQAAIYMLAQANLSRRTVGMLYQ